MMKKVLVVDDSSDERKILTTILERQAYEVVEAGDGVEGLEKAVQTRPDLIISDALMPRLDGFQFLREVKKDPRLRSIPFIFYSAVYSGYKEAELAIFLGALAFIVRPKEPEEFWKELSRVLAQQWREKTDTAAAVKLLEEDRVFLEKYSQIVVGKLLETVAELRKTVSELELSQEAFKENEERLRMAAYAGGVGTFDINVEAGEVFRSQEMTSMLGLAANAPARISLDESWQSFHPDEVESVKQHYQESLDPRGTGVYQDEHRVVRQDGEVRWFLIRGRTFFTDEGREKRPVRSIGVILDITERKNLEYEIRHMGLHDSLTGLPNRRLFRELIGLEFAQADRNGKKVGVLFLDLDRFKEINDALGHIAGDALLREAAERLKSHVRKTDTVARIGGDEFNIILTDITRAEDGAEVARNIINAFRRPFVVEGHELNSTASIGISMYPDDSREPETLFRYADIALHHAKQLGKNGYRFYESSINVTSLERMRLKGMLQHSIESGQILIYYQPLIDVDDRRIVSAEALARWNHPRRGILIPEDFIPAAEETGFIRSLDEWTLRSACTQVRSWLDSGLGPICISVNLSARQFQDPDLVKKISAILHETRLPAHCLDIEITETIAMADVERSVALLNELAKIGVRITVDDFGTGYSSLSYLKKLPINRLKIDKSFIRDIPGNIDDRTIVETVIAMAHNMKMKVVAEGVETKEQLEFLKQSGCDELQGFLFSEPLPADRFRELIETGK